MNNVKQCLIFCGRIFFKVPENLKLTDDQIDGFVNAMLPAVLYSVFSVGENIETCQIIRSLAFISPHFVLPKVLDMLVVFFSCFAGLFWVAELRRDETKSFG